MRTRAINSPDAPAAAGGYAQAVEVTGAQRLLFVSGQIPVDREGVTPKGFTSQAELAWANVEAQLKAADMTLDNLVKVTTFLADRAHALENRDVRNAVLADRTPALTVIITGIFDPDWLIEIEAVAAG
ncbi:RidA family protein [Phenylobacterium sp.]|uniref:RidA family protein n=1 Tax=Phenylobacterium sp. TaxID=1871053 RepID=UPI002ED77657